MTESGKTTLAKALAREYKARGFGVIVLDPLADPAWNCDFRTHEVGAFLKAFYASRACMAFIDESGDAIGHYDDVMIRTATRGRHWGHSCHYLTQRGALLSPTVRDQCSHLFLFTSGHRDCKTHSDEWNQPELLEARNLPRGHYFHATRYGFLERGKLWGNADDTVISSRARYRRIVGTV
jgi:hypothetical protein